MTGAPPVEQISHSDSPPLKWVLCFLGVFFVDFWWLIFRNWQELLVMLVWDRALQACIISIRHSPSHWFKFYLMGTRPNATVPVRGPVSSVCATCLPRGDSSVCNAEHRLLGGRPRPCLSHCWMEASLHGGSREKTTMEKEEERNDGEGGGKERRPELLDTED